MFFSTFSPACYPRLTCGELNKSALMHGRPAYARTCRHDRVSCRFAERTQRTGSDRRGSPFRVREGNTHRAPRADLNAVAACADTRTLTRRRFWPCFGVETRRERDVAGVPWHGGTHDGDCVDGGFNGGVADCVECNRRGSVWTWVRCFRASCVARPRSEDAGASSNVRAPSKRSCLVRARLPYERSELARREDSGAAPRRARSKVAQKRNTVRDVDACMRQVLAAPSLLP